MQIPKNVIQTGETDPCHKIYMEDYVHTLLTQYRENEADFCLYGEKGAGRGDFLLFYVWCGRGGTRLGTDGKPILCPSAENRRDNL